MKAPDSRKRLIVKCPQCAKTIDWVSAPFRPFCSKRCQVLDQAAWAGEKYQISTQPDVPDSSHNTVQSMGREPTEEKS